MNPLNALFPKTKAKVLTVLLRDSDKEIHFRELARQTGLGVGPVQRELSNLLKAEIVSSRRDGNRQYYRANKDHPIYHDLRNVFLKCDGAADLLREALIGIPGIRVAFIFGSMAKQTEKATSDLDVMVIGSCGLRTLVPALRPVGDAMQREVNPYTITPQSWEKRLSEKDAFITGVNEGAKTFIIGNQNELEGMGR